MNMHLLEVLEVFAGFAALLQSDVVYLLELVTIAYEFFLNLIMTRSFVAAAPPTLRLQ